MPKARDLYLPDSGYVGRMTHDKPDDVELPSVSGERRVLRYAGGALVDAWWVRHGPLDPGEFARAGNEEWRGPVLGPAFGTDEDGWRAVGDAVSWTTRDRTALYWKDRDGDVEILVSRAVPTGSYGVARAAPLAPLYSSDTRPSMRGALKKWAKPAALALSGCVDNAPKPVELTVSVKFDDQAQLARLRADADQTATNLSDCVAAAIGTLRGPAPNAEGAFGFVRLR